MKDSVHPKYVTVQVTGASCGNTFETVSTLGHYFQADVCSNCHPFYTGRQRAVDAGGRVEKFRSTYRAVVSAVVNANA